MKNKQLLITIGLAGVLIGMLLSVFLSFTIPAASITYILEKSCNNTKPKSIDIKYLGKFITLKCENGEIHNYNLLVWDTNN